MSTHSSRIDETRFPFFSVFPRWSAAVAVCLAAQLCHGAPDGKKPEPADFYVAPNGNDAWSGTLPAVNEESTDGPFATLGRVRNAVREFVAGDGRDVTVLIRGGRYQLGETVVFSREDSAGDGHTITYAAYPGEKPVFSAAEAIAGWRKLEKMPEGLPEVAHGKVWVADVSRHPAMKPVPDGRSPRFFTLYRDGRELPRARGRGFSPVNVIPRGQKDDSQTIEFSEGAVKNYRNLADAEVRIIPSRFWIMNLLPIASVDEAARILRTAQRGTYPLGKNGMTDRDNAWVENVIEALDTPGEWVLDSGKGELFYWPVEGEPGKGVLAPVLTELIRIEGGIDYDGPVDDPVKGLVFRGLTFTQGDRYPWHGGTGWGVQHDWECFDKPTALVRLRGAERCAVEDCEFTLSGNTGVRLDLHCQDNRIVGNHIHDIGGVGILLAGYGPGTKDVNRRNQVTNNYVHHTGRQYWGSPAVFAWQSGENRIAHNHIHHTPYTAICVTGRISRGQPGSAECSRTVRWHELPEEFSQWTWEQREPYLHGRRNVVEWNDIHHAMEITGDGNCIYVSGTGGGNVVRTNYCHDCVGKYMNAVIRCDDDQHGTIMEGNVCHRTRGYGEGFISKGDNAIVNNFVIDLRPQERHRGYIVFPYGDVKGSKIQRNVLFSSQEGQILYYHEHATTRGSGPPRLRDCDAGGNLYFCTEDPDWAGEHFAKQREFGIEGNSRFADPLFVDADGGDFRFRPGSPAPGMGIESIDVSKAGLEPAWRERHVGRRIRTRISPEGGRLREAAMVSVECDARNVEIRYTLDGSEPTKRSMRYEGPFEVDRDCEVRARAFAADAVDLVGAYAWFEGPPEPIVQDFEELDPGDKTPGATTSEGERAGQYTARVTDECAAGGAQCLKFVDGPEQKHPFNPHVYFRTEFTEGRMVGRFDLRVSSAARFSFQWRDYSSPGYATGPAIQIQPGGELTHGDETLLTLPADEWVEIEVGCDLGDEASGAFELRVDLPGEAEPRVFPDLKCQAGFRELDWVGFIMNGKEVATGYVDNIEVRPAK